jgi:hypothetical protein
MFPVGHPLPGTRDCRLSREEHIDLPSQAFLYMRFKSVLLAAVAALALPLASASAQERSGPSQVISIQPLNAMLTVYSGEYERRTGRSVTVGIGGTHWSPGGVENGLTFTAGDLKLRYYPQGAALHGFSMGLVGGYFAASGTLNGVKGETEGASFGTVLEYQWLMGASSNVSVALGGGAKVLMPKNEKVDNLSVHYPTARISIGYGF